MFNLRLNNYNIAVQTHCQMHMIKQIVQIHCQMHFFIGFKIYHDA